MTSQPQKTEFTGYLIAYARVSTADQDLALQKDAFEKMGGIQRVFEEKKSGKDLSRPILKECLDYLRSGDVLVVWKLDRLGRSLKDLISTIEDLESRGIGFRSISENLDTTTPAGKLLFHIIGAISQFERDLISERTSAGLAAAQKRGVKMGRPPAISREKLRKIDAVLATGSFSLKEALKDYGVQSESTYYRAKRRFEEQDAAMDMEKEAA